MSRSSDTNNPTSYRGRFKGQIYDWDREYAYTRDDLTHKSIDMYALANFGKGFFRAPKPDKNGSIEDSETFIRAMEKVDRDVNFTKNLFMAYRLGMINRISFIAYGFEDSGELSTEPSGAVALTELITLKSSKVSVDKWDNNTGAPLQYKITQNVGEGNVKEYLVHASRIMPIVPFPYDDNFAGMSALDHIFDQFLVKKDFEWMKAEAARRHVIPFCEVTYPDDEEAEDYAIDNFSNGYEGKDAFLHSAEEGWEFELHEVKGTFPYGEFYKWIVDMQASGLNVPRVMALGTGEGTVSGSDVNVQTFFSNVASNQTIMISPWVREHDLRVLDSGLLRTLGYSGTELPEYEIVFNAPYELTGKELAQKNRLDAIAEKEWVTKSIYTINEIRKNRGDPPSDHPFSDMLMYDGIPLEIYWITKMPQGVNMTNVAKELGMDIDLKPELVPMPGFGGDPNGGPQQPNPTKPETPDAKGAPSEPDSKSIGNEQDLDMDGDE